MESPLNTGLQIRAELLALLELLGRQKQLLRQPLQCLVLVMGNHHTTEVTQHLAVLNRVLSCTRKDAMVRNLNYSASNTR